MAFVQRLEAGGMFSDWKKAVLRAPLHVLASLPVAIVSVAVPAAGMAYVRWRRIAEEDDVVLGRDTPEKATIDFYTQTVLVNQVLRWWGTFCHAEREPLTEKPFSITFPITRDDVENTTDLPDRRQH